MNYIKLLFILLSFSILTAQNPGGIEGYVFDGETGEVLPGVNLTIENSTIGAPTDINGYFEIVNLPAGKYTINVRYVGYNELKFPDIEVLPDSITMLELKLMPSNIIMNDVIITAQRPVIKKNITNSMSISRTGNEAYFTVVQPGVAFNTEEYSSLPENGFSRTNVSPVSTFAADIDGASYSNARRFIVEENRLPVKGSVRVEEFVNYFDYSYAEPVDDKPLSVNLEYGDCPWNDEHKIVHIGLQSKKLEVQSQQPNNLVFLIDVSGSMDQENKLPLLKKAFKLLVRQLDSRDKVAIVTYAGATGVALPSTSCSEKERILQVIENFDAGGSTAGGAGIKLAYETASRNFIPDGNNRVILATDGDFNVGISNTAELVDYIAGYRDKGIFLSVLGFGTGNYKDERLQQLADKGNGNHAYIDNLLEAKKVLVNEMQATLYTVAKDVKIQVEFNPAYVKSYRLIGYENRMLNKEDFTDDKKDAGEIGAGHTVTALYEIEPGAPSEYQNELKYQSGTLNDTALQSGEVLTVKIRYKEPDEDNSKEFAAVLDADMLNKNLTDNFRFSCAVAGLGMLLDESDYRGNICCDSILELAKDGMGEDKYGYRAEFLSMVERVKLIKEL